MKTFLIDGDEPQKTIP